MTRLPIAIAVPPGNHEDPARPRLAPPTDRRSRRRPPARYPARLSSSFHLTAGALFAGDFRIVRPLSEGGMGAVYVVEQVSTGKERALKIMHGQLVAHERLRQRFEQEARVGARIESDHVVEVVGAGVDSATGMPWLAMELLRGETLGALLARSGALAPAVVRDVFGQICHALGAAHTLGIVHRDLKPENVFLEVPKREGVAFTAKILDFGIAKMIAESATKHTAAIGTPLWMAPEQTESRGIVSPATDVWSLGLIAFHLLTGRVYWREGNADAPSTMVLLREICVDALPFASMRAAELGVGPLIPRGFDEWFGRCVHRDPHARFSDATALRRALDPILGQTVSSQASTMAMPPSPGARTLAVAAQETVVPPQTRVTPETIGLPRPLQAQPLPPAPSSSGNRMPLMISAAAALGLVTVLLVFLLRKPPTTTPTNEANNAATTTQNDDPLASTASTTIEIKTESTTHTTTTTTSAEGFFKDDLEPQPPPEPQAPLPPGPTQVQPKPSKKQITLSGEGATSTDDPPFDRSAALTALQAVAYKDCGAGGAGHVKLTFAPSGTVTFVTVDAGNYDGATRSCIALRFRAAKVPRFSGAAVIVGKSISL